MRRLGALILLLVLAAGPVSSAASPRALAAPPAAAGKVAPWVTTHTTHGQTAEFLVVLNQQADLSAAATLPTKQAKGRYVYDTLWQTAQATQAPLLAWLSAHGIPHRSYYLVNLIWVKGDARVVQALAARAEVARLEANPLIANSVHLASAAPASAAPNGIETNLTYVHANDVWAQGFTGQGIVIGGQDTGYQWDHPALQPHYRGWDGTTASHDYNWHDSIHTPNLDCPADGPAPCDDHGHGTHTLGIAVGDDNAGNQIGMAPGAQWIGCRNMNDGVGTPATYLECFEWFLAPYPVGGTPAQGNPDLAPDVTNNSWGCPPSEGCAFGSLLAAVEAQRAAGILTVVSAGNLGSGCSTVVDPPSIYDAAYTVGSLNKGTDTIAFSSSRGPVTIDGSQRLKPDIAAPGTTIRSSVPISQYANLSGTSMAAPHVAGAVALLWSARPALRGQLDATEAVLNFSAHDLPSSTCGADGVPNNTFGYGRLDVLAAVNGAPGEFGSLTGTITEKFTNATVAGAHIAATLAADPILTFQFVTDLNGVYTDTVAAGLYTVTVTHPLRPPVTLSNITVSPDAVTTADAVLNPNLLLPAFFLSLLPHPARFASTY